MHHDRTTFHSFVTRSVQLKTDVMCGCGQPLAGMGLTTPRAVGDALESVSEKRWTITEQPNATHGRINEAGDCAEQPGLHDEGRPEPA